MPATLRRVMTLAASSEPSSFDRCERSSELFPGEESGVFGDLLEILSGVVEDHLEPPDVPEAEVDEPPPTQGTDCHCF